jgi:RNA polymerase sigma-70 factor, ECF subfamily
MRGHSLQYPWQSKLCLVNPASNMYVDGRMTVHLYIHSALSGQVKRKLNDGSSFMLPPQQRPSMQPPSSQLGLSGQTLEIDSNSQTNYTDLVLRVRNNDEAATQRLYHLFQPMVRHLIARQILTEIDDHVQDVLWIVITAVRSDKLRDPEALPAYVRGIVRNKIYEAIHEAVNTRTRFTSLEFVQVEDPRQSSEQAILAAERQRLMREALQRLRPCDREILVRFYLDRQLPEQIMREMNLNPTQFRLLKSRAKAKLTSAAASVSRRRAHA